MMVKMLLAFGVRPDSQVDVHEKQTKAIIILPTHDARNSAIFQLLASYGASAPLASYSGVAPTAISQESRAVGGFANTSQHCFRSDLLEHFYSQL